MDPLDRELSSLLSVEPSPEFRARVRTRVAVEPAPQSWQVHWRLALAGVTALAVVLAVVLGRVDRLDKAQALPATAFTTLPISVPAPPAVATAVVRPARRHEPEVLVAPSEARGLSLLEDVVREGRTHFVFFDEGAVAASPEPVKDIVIAPISIAPLDIAANSEGDGQ